MGKRRSRWLDYLVYLVVRFVVCVVQALTAPAVWRVAELLAWFCYHVDRRHRLVAAENLRQAFPHLSDAGVDQLVRKVYRHFCLVVMEMILMPRKYHRSNIDRFVHYPNPADQQRGIGWFKSKRPLITVSGHFGNWEMLSYMLGMSGMRGAVVARRLDNPYLDRFVKRFRIATGQRVLDKNEDYDKIRQTLATGSHLGVMCDQDAGPRGVFVDFFGRPASTYKSIALLALEYDALVMVGYSIRRPDKFDNQFWSRFEVGCEVVIDPRDIQSEDPVGEITRQFTAALERAI